MPRVKGARDRYATPDNLRARAWQSMRILRRFSRPQVQTTVAGLSQTNADKYIRALLRAGYLRVAQEHVSGRPGSYLIFQLVRDTGPLCPVCWKNGQVYDQNNKQTYGRERDG
jgi:hypothetical protein